MIVDRCGRAGRDHERKETERLVLGAIERVLADAAAHRTRLVRPGAAVRQPAVRVQQRFERGPQRRDARGDVGDRRAEPPRFFDQRAQRWSVDKEPVRLAVVRLGMVRMAKVTHDLSILRRT
jgi:hypothetical protein